MKRFLLAITLIGLATGTVAAEVPGTTWDTLLHRQVVVTYTDGTQATGTLAAVKSATISLSLTDGSVTTVAKGTVEAVSPLVASTQSSSTRARGGLEVFAAAANSPSANKSTDGRASSGASMAMGIRDANMRYHWGSLYFLAGLGLGLIGVGLSYTAQPTPAVTPNPEHVDVSSYIAGYQMEAEKKAHRSAWGGFATRAAIVALVVIAALQATSQGQSTHLFQLSLP